MDTGRNAAYDARKMGFLIDVASLGACVINAQ